MDIHNHSVGGIQEEPAAASRIAKGITTLALGADGGGTFEVKEFLDEIEAHPPAPNVLTFVGHGTVRRHVLGDDFKRRASDPEINEMGELVEQAMREGACGLSSGLEYDPGFYSSADEVIRLANIASRHDGIYMRHIPNTTSGRSRKLPMTGR